jgi:L-ribulose-5-phosphate 4-epimerase
MSLSALRDEVCRANRDLVAAGLVTLSFGNASGVDRDAGVLVIKPSGIDYSSLRAEDMVVVRLADGEVVEGALRPSSDTPTHLELYRAFGSIGGVVHTHSPFASAWAQAQRPIPCLGTTHADHFAGEVPVTRPLTDREIDGAYERETGVVIVETFRDGAIDPLHVPAVLVASHGPFAWGTDAGDAVTNAIALEAIAAMAHRTIAIAADVERIGEPLQRRHFLRKHGPDAYYGQPRR